MAKTNALLQKMVLLVAVTAFGMVGGCEHGPSGGAAGSSGGSTAGSGGSSTGSSQGSTGPSGGSTGSSGGSAGSSGGSAGSSGGSNSNSNPPAAGTNVTSGNCRLLDRAGCKANAASKCAYSNAFAPEFKGVGGCYLDWYTPGNYKPFPTCNNAAKWHCDQAFSGVPGKKCVEKPAVLTSAYEVKGHCALTAGFSPPNTCAEITQALLDQAKAEPGNSFMDMSLDSFCDLNATDRKARTIFGPWGGAILPGETRTCVSNRYKGVCEAARVDNLDAINALQRAEINDCNEILSDRCQPSGTARFGRTFVIGSAVKHSCVPSSDPAITTCVNAPPRSQGSDRCEGKEGDLVLAELNAKCGSLGATCETDSADYNGYKFCKTGVGTGTCIAAPADSLKAEALANKACSARKSLEGWVEANDPPDGNVVWKVITARCGPVEGPTGKTWDICEAL